MSSFTLVYGGSGALGSTIVEKFSKSVPVISVDFRENAKAAHNIVITPGLSLTEQGQLVLNKVSSILGGHKLKAILCVAGGWAGGDASDDKFLANSALMLEQSLWTSLICVRMASLYLQEGGLVVLPGAKPALGATPGMLPYGVAKSAVHFLTKAASKGLPKDSKIVAILPVTLDTPTNRKYMKYNESWTSLEDVADLLLGWQEDIAKVKDNSLYTIVTENKKMSVSEVTD